MGRREAKRGGELGREGDQGLHGDALHQANVPGELRVVAPDEKRRGVDKAVDAELEEAVTTKL